LINRAVLLLPLALLLPAASRAAGRPLRIGDPAPPLHLQKVLQAPEGASVSWDALRGKVVLLEFWGTWCPPCLPAMEHLDRVAGALAGRPFQVIAITTEREEPVARYLAKNPSRLWIGMDTASATWNAYQVGGVPHTVIVSPEGRIAAITHPTNVTAEAIEGLLAGKGIDLPPKAGGEVEATSQEDGEEALYKAVLRPLPSLVPAKTDLDSTGRWISVIGPPKLLVQTAYNVSHTRMVFETDLTDLPAASYEAEVRVPEGSESLLLPTLQQMVLASFRLTVTREPRPLEVLVLQTIPEAPGPRISQQAQGNSRVNRSGTTIDAQGISMEKLADSLGNALKDIVVDETGLTDRYDLFLDWDPEQPDALNRELAKLGLKLVEASRPVGMVVVRSAGPAVSSPAPPVP
jgi:uncharacterized protein (TIGR03435 family)